MLARKCRTKLTYLAKHQHSCFFVVQVYILGITPEMCHHVFEGVLTYSTDKIITKKTKQLSVHKHNTSKTADTLTKNIKKEDTLIK